MSRVWFTNRNAGALRSFLRSIILQEFETQVRRPTYHLLNTPHNKQI